MALNFETIKQSVEKYTTAVRDVFPVEKVVLFGSYAKGTATELSDVDICFFLGSFGGKRRVDVIRELLSLTHDYEGVYFEPIAFPSSEIQNDNPFVKEILRTGVEVQ